MKLLEVEIVDNLDASVEMTQFMEIPMLGCGQFRCQCTASG